MGDIAEMTLDGILCQKCGDFLGEPVGFPRTCTLCRPRRDGAGSLRRQKDREFHRERQALNRAQRGPVAPRTCGQCGKVCKSPDGVRAHAAAVHGGSAGDPSV